MAVWVYIQLYKPPLIVNSVAWVQVRILDAKSSKGICSTPPPLSTPDYDCCCGVFVETQAQPVSAAGILGHKFVPSLVSNVVFLLATIQSVSVTVVNFKGRPFMRGNVL